MKTNKILVSLLALMLVALTSTTFASDYEDDDRYEYRDNYKDDDRYDDDRYERNEYKENYRDNEDDDRYERNEYKENYRDNEDDDRYERNEYKENYRDNEDDDRYERDRDEQITQKKKENTKLKAEYKSAIKKKLGNRLDNIDKTKLETIVVIIDTKLLELEADTTKTDVQKEKLVAIYGALRDLISEKIAETATDGIIDGLLK